MNLMLMRGLGVVLVVIALAGERLLDTMGCDFGSLGHSVVGGSVVFGSDMAGS